MQLRRLVQAARLTEQGHSVLAAIDLAGFPPFARQQAQEHLRHVGSPRINELLTWLVDVDLGLKGGSQLPPAVLMEILVVRLARNAELTSDAPPAGVRESAGRSLRPL
jgi:DNA polymerase III delta subunit